MGRVLLLSIYLISISWQASVQASTPGPAAMKSDVHKVKNWNLFAEQLYILHQSQLENRTIRTEAHIGGYATHPQFYEETRYYDAESGVLLSRIQRESRNKETVHLIEVNVYDTKNKLQRDYLAAYLPEHRNAPIQTLINLHAHNNGLHAFRQFDASGDRIYEQCQGKHKGKEVFITLDEDQFSAGPYQRKKILNSQLYKLCFTGIPAMVDTHVLPVTGARPASLDLWTTPGLAVAISDRRNHNFSTP